MEIPSIVKGMSSGELEEFKKWLSECCSYDFEKMTYNELHHAAGRWYEEQREEEEI